MKLQFHKEIPIWIITLCPILYLAINWVNIPGQFLLPDQFNIATYTYGVKTDLIILAIFPSFLVYLILLAALYIDPKNRLQEMGNKYDQLRFFICALIAAIVILFITTIIFQVDIFMQSFCLLIGLLFALIGNYALSLKPNYFIGFRTPWTLENETVWRRTHEFGGKIWFVGGLLLIAINLLVDLQELELPVLIAFILVLAIIPIWFSYFVFQKINQNISGL